MHDMLNEIYQQPDVVERLLDQRKDAISEVARIATSRGIRQIILVARGTSDHAAIYGMYLFQVKNGLAASLATPSVVTLYDSQVKLPDTMVIGISQSGQAQDVMEYMARAKKNGNPTVAITNDAASPMAQIADITIDLAAGPEKSVAATKTYTASLCALAMLSVALSGKTERYRILEEAPELMRGALGKTDFFEEFAEATKRDEECFVVGRGLSYATALETALKVMETCYVRAKAYSAADLLHGPVAAAQAVPCITYVGNDPTQTSILEVATRLKDAGTRVLIVSSDKSVMGHGTEAVAIPGASESWVDPLVQIIAGQRIAYHLSVAKGLNPDAPRGLSKVTVTV